MSQQFPPPSTHVPGAYGPPVPHGAPSPYAGAYAGPPAYLGMPGPAARPSGLNPWVAALLGAVGGGVITAVLGLMMVFSTGMPMPWEGTDDWVDDWVGQVDVAADGSVAGPALADAVLELGAGDYYEDVVCKPTPKVATDVTTLCDVDDGYERYRVVVVFTDDRGGFEAAEIYTQ